MHTRYVYTILISYIHTTLLYIYNRYIMKGNAPLFSPHKSTESKHAITTLNQCMVEQGLNRNAQPLELARYPEYISLPNSYLNILKVRECVEGLLRILFRVYLFSGVYYIMQVYVCTVFVLCMAYVHYILHIIIYAFTSLLIYMYV